MSGDVRKWMLILALTMAGCDGEAGKAADRPANAYVPPAKAGERGVLRVKVDGARGRLWVLGVDDVRVYDAGRRQFIRRIALPNWSVARFTCDPDMVLDGSGSPLISSNTQPKLWRIDADTFEVQERAIRLLDREEWDVGFGSLLLTRNGNLMALSATGGWLWSIDLVSGDASLWNWGSPMLNACDLAPVE